MSKKRLSITSIFLYILIFACIGCGGKSPSVEPEPTQTASATSAPVVLESAMPESTENAEELGGRSYCIDYKNVMFNSLMAPNMAETDECLYLLLNNTIYMTDKEYKDWMPLCAKPDCKHNGRDCNAYVDSESLILYDKYLYYVEGSGQQTDDKYKVTLCRMGLDGSAHEKVCDLRELMEPEHTYRVDSSAWSVYATGKYLIVCVGLLEIRGQSTHIPHRYYYSFDLETQQAEQILSEYINGEGSEDPLCFTLYEGRGSHAYGSISSLAVRNNLLVDVDLATGETRELMEFDGEIYYYERGIGIIDGKLYFRVVDVPEGAYTGDEMQYLYALDLETCELTLVDEGKIGESRWFVLDVDAGYWYSFTINGAEESHGFYVSDLEKNVVDFIPLSEYPEEFGGRVQIGRVTDDYIFAKPLDDSGFYDDNLLPVWYLSKADIGTDNLMWRRWEP